MGTLKGLLARKPSRDIPPCIVNGPSPHKARLSVPISFVMYFLKSQHPKNNEGLSFFVKDENNPKTKITMKF